MKKKLEELEKRIEKNEELIKVLTLLIKMQLEQEEYNHKFREIVKSALNGFGL